MVRIASTGETRKALAARLQQSYANHARRLIRRIRALLRLADGRAVCNVAHLLAVGEQTVRDWLHAFVLNGVASLVYWPRPGRPAKLTASQRRELAQLRVASSEASRYSSFRLRMNAEMVDLLWEGAAVAGVRYRTPEGELHVVRTRLRYLTFLH